MVNDVFMLKAEKNHIPTQKEKKKKRKRKKDPPPPPTFPHDLQRNYEWTFWYVNKKKLEEHKILESKMQS